jgi:hypothetical protein
LKSVPVSIGSISSSGVSTVSQCDTDEPPSCGLGAYIRTWVPTLPALSTLLAAATLAPTQWRSPVSVLEASR